MSEGKTLGRAAWDSLVKEAFRISGEDGHACPTWVDGVLDGSERIAELQQQVEALEDLRLMLIGAVAHAEEFGNGNIAAASIKKFLGMTGAEQLEGE